MRNDAVGLAKQTDLATAKTTMDYFLPVETATPSMNREQVTIEETIGNRFPTGMDYGVRFWEIAMAGAARASSFPRVLSAFLGAPTSAVQSDPTTYLHSFDPAAVGKLPLPHSIIVDRDDPTPNITDLFVGCLGNTLTLSVEPNGFLRYEAGFVAQQLDQTQAAPTVIMDNSPRFTFDQVIAYLKVGAGTETAFPCGSFSLEYLNNVPTDEAVLGSKFLYTLKEGNADATVSFVAREGPAPDLRLLDHYRRALLDSPALCQARIMATGAVTGGALKYQFEVKVPAFEYVDAPAAVAAADRLSTLEVSGRCRLDPVTSKFVQVNVQNKVASYP